MIDNIDNIKHIKSVQSPYKLKRKKQINPDYLSQDLTVLIHVNISAYLCQLFQNDLQGKGPVTMPAFRKLS